MKRTREEEEKGEQSREKVARLDPLSTVAEAGELGLESLGTDILLLVMQFCGAETTLRAFFLANHYLHFLVCNNQALWRRAFLALHEPPLGDEDLAEQYEDVERRARQKEDEGEPENYFRAYLSALQRWRGVYTFAEEGVCLAEYGGSLSVEVDFFGQATWAGEAVGDEHRTSSYTSLNCLKGEGQLVLARKEGTLVAYVSGHEDSVQDSCQRVRDIDYYYEEDDDDDDEDDDEDDEDEDVKDDDWRKSRREDRALERAEKLLAEAEEEPVKWLEATMAELQPPFAMPVRYYLHKGLFKRDDRPEEGRFCTGGFACRTWQDDIEW